MTESRLSVSVLMPAYNEATTVAGIVRRVLALEMDLREIIVVDDGSTDATAEIVRGIAAVDPRVKLVRFERNRGKTAAIARAIKEATGDIIAIQDADLEYDPSELSAVVAPILQGRADVVYGSRFLIRHTARTLYFSQYLANRSLTLLSNLLTHRKMTDIETGHKAFRAGVIKPLSLTSKGFGLEVEITAMICRTKARTCEVPISYYGRTYQEGKKISARDGFAAVFYVIYFNLIRPWFPSSRAYIAQVNAFLQADGDGRR